MADPSEIDQLMVIWTQLGERRKQACQAMRDQLLAIQAAQRRQLAELCQDSADLAAAEAGLDLRHRRQRRDLEDALRRPSVGSAEPVSGEEKARALAELRRRQVGRPDGIPSDVPIDLLVDIVKRQLTPLFEELKQRTRFGSALQDLKNTDPKLAAVIQRHGLLARWKKDVKLLHNPSRRRPRRKATSPLWMACQLLEQEKNFGTAATIERRAAAARAARKEPLDAD
jgi:hypothetical protein